MKLRHVEFVGRETVYHGLHLCPCVLSVETLGVVLEEDLEFTQGLDGLRLITIGRPHHPHVAHCDHELRVVHLTALVLDRRRLEHRIDGRGLAGVRGAGVVHDALQFLRVRQPPVGVAGVFEIFRPAKSFPPVHCAVFCCACFKLAAVDLHPHQSGSFVCNGTVAIVFEVVCAIVPITADVHNMVRFFPAAPDACRRISLDPPICKVNAEHFFGSIHNGTHIDAGGNPLRVDESLAGVLVAVGEVEVVGVDVGFGFSG